MTIDAKEIARLERKHRDIAEHGAGALVKQAEREQRQRQMAEFVAEHGLSCFKCGSVLNAWAATGAGQTRYWAICQVCVRKK